MAEKGSLVDKPAAEIFRELALGGGSGVLRLANDRHVRVVVFEEGRPVFGISNVPEDQLDVLLVRQRKITPDQATMAKRLIQKEAELPDKLVELGMLEPHIVATGRLDQVTRVIQSAMTMREGEYLLDPTARVAHDISVDPPIRQWLLDTARSVTAEQARALLGPPDEVFSGADPGEIELSPLDSFLLSRISAPLTVDEIHDVSGFPEEQSVPAIYALYAAGLLVPVSGSLPKVGAAGAGGQETPIDEIRLDLERALAAFARMDYYEILGVERRATTSDVKKGYYALAKQYHPDRYHHASDPDIAEKLEAVFAQVARAYETLKDAHLRADYDRRLGEGIPLAAAPTVAAPAPTASAPPPRPIVPPPPPPSPIAAPPPPKPAAPAARAPRPQPAPPPPIAPPPEPPPPEPPPPVTSTDPGRMAEQHFQEGMRRLNQHDVMGALGMLREAIRLAPDKGVYHFHLGTLLAANPRWHKEAEKHLLEAARTDPLNTQVFLKLGQIYQESGLTKRAEAQYRAVLAINANDRVARRALIDMGCDVPAGRGGEGGGSGLFSKLFKKK